MTMKAAWPGIDLQQPILPPRHPAVSSAPQIVLVKVQVSSGKARLLDAPMKPSRFELLRSIISAMSLTCAPPNDPAWRSTARVWLLQCEKEAMLTSRRRCKTRGAEKEASGTLPFGRHCIAHRTRMRVEYAHACVYELAKAI